MFIAVIEWDGKQPPTTYYNRLRSMGLKVRGDKEKAPVVRRASTARTFSQGYEWIDSDERMERNSRWGETGRYAGREAKATDIHHGLESEIPDMMEESTDVVSTIAQEGVVLCASEYLAEMVCHIAIRYGAKTAMVGRTDLRSPGMDKDVNTAIAKLDAVAGKRGRPPSNVVGKRLYSYTCLECNDSGTVQLDTTPIYCYRCRSPLINVTEGARPLVAHVSNAGIIDAIDAMTYWNATRWWSGKYIIAELNNNEVTVPDSFHVPTDIETMMNKFVEGEFYKFVIEKCRVNEWVMVLDAAYMSMRASQEKIDARRVAACIELYKLGVDPSKAPLNPDVLGVPDAIDCYAVSHAVQPLVVAWLEKSE